MIFDKLREECGVAGVLGNSEASNWIYLALYALQHRGQEACGIISYDEKKIAHIHRSFGLVADSIDRDVLSKLPGNIAIGHVRYSTQGGKSFNNIQPFFFNTESLGPIAVSHNGNITNAKYLKKNLEAKGSVFQSTSDTEVLVHLIAHSQKPNLDEKILDALSYLKGAYSFVIASSNTLYLARDKFGFRPLVYGNKDGAFIAASEGCALDLLDAKIVREVEPGEVLKVTESKIDTKNGENYFLQVLRTEHGNSKVSFCSFEPIYFARPDSRIFGNEVYEVRKRIGRQLAKQRKIEADVVIAVPDSGVPMAIAYAQESGIEYAVGLVRNHYVGRTFIEPSQAIRDFGVKLKLNPVLSVLKDKRVIVVDDSIVRGTTSEKIIRMLRKAGAKEIHLCIGAPPITDPCYFGVDTPRRADLLAAKMQVEAMCKFVGADSLEFLQLENLKESLGADANKKYCFGCFTGHYPEEIGS